MARQKHLVLTKFYVYDPAVNVGDELGRLRVREDEDNENGKYILASPMQVQYWIDQGLLGTDPISKLGEASKALLKQITRGRSEDEEPGRLPRYSKQMQSGEPQFAGTMAAMRRKKAMAAKSKHGSKDPQTKAKNERDIRTGQPKDAKKPGETVPAERPVVAPVQ
jgi:hypothetical protein